VVETHERLAVAARAPHVREEYGDAELVQQVVVAAEKAGPRLAFGPAVDVDDEWPLAWKLRRIQAIEESRHGLAIEALHFDALGFDVLRRLELAGLAGGPARDGQRSGIDG